MKRRSQKFSYAILLMGFLLIAASLTGLVKEKSHFTVPIHGKGSTGLAEMTKEETGPGVFLLFVPGLCLSSMGIWLVIRGRRFQGPTGSDDEIGL